MDSCNNQAVSRYYEINDINTTKIYASITVKRFEDIFGVLDDLDIKHIINQVYQ